MKNFTEIKAVTKYISQANTETQIFVMGVYGYAHTCMHAHICIYHPTSGICDFSPKSIAESSLNHVCTSFQCYVPACFITAGSPAKQKPTVRNQLKWKHFSFQKQQQLSKNVFIPRGNLLVSSAIFTMCFYELKQSGINPSHSAKCFMQQLPLNISQHSIQFHTIQVIH